MPEDAIQLCRVSTFLPLPWLCLSPFLSWFASWRRQ